jgi:ketosteroid isomerase-like protein
VPDENGPLDHKLGPVAQPNADKRQQHETAPLDSGAMTTDDVDEEFAIRFAERFAETWRTPDLAKHEALWSDDIVLIQPMMGALRGKQACRGSFQRLFALVPDLHADVHRVGHGKHEVFIEFTLSGTYGGKPIAWDAVDRFTFTNGLVAERVSYFDSTPLIGKLVARPAGWDRLVRIGSQLFRR